MVRGYRLAYYTAFFPVVNELTCLVFVFDFDGVLARGDEPRELGVRFLAKAVKLGGRVYIVSGRRPRDRGVIRTILKEAGIGLNRLRGLYLREAGSEEAFKLEVYREIYDREGCIGEIHDDNPEALWPARKLVDHGLILHYDDYCEVLYGYSILDSCR